MARKKVLFIKPHKAPCRILSEVPRPAWDAFGPWIWNGRGRWRVPAVCPGPSTGIDRQFLAYFDLTGRAIGDEADRNVCFQLSDAQARPALFGTTIAALVWLGRAIRQPWPADLARRYLRLVLSHQTDPAALPLTTKSGWAALLLNEGKAEPDFSGFAHRVGLQLLVRQDPDGGINFDDVPEVTKPIDKVWRLGWTCDAALTLVRAGRWSRLRTLPYRCL